MLAVTSFIAASPPCPATAPPAVRPFHYKCRAKRRADQKALAGTKPPEGACLISGQTLSKRLSIEQWTATTGGALRIAVVVGPRNISTAMMRAFENRPEAAASSEPLYAH
jgi:hypothetical protein